MRNDRPTGAIGSTDSRVRTSFENFWNQMANLEFQGTRGASDYRVERVHKGANFEGNTGIGHFTRRRMLIAD